MGRRRRRAAIAALVAALLLAGGRAGAEVPAGKQALIILRVLAYDHALARRAGGTVRLTVVHGDSAQSLRCAGQMRTAFDKLAGRALVNGRPFAVQSAPVAELGLGVLTRSGSSVVYVCGGSDGEVAAIARAARAAGALTFTDQLRYVERGLAVALHDGADRVAISVNLVAARAEGAQLSGQFLKLSKVVKQ